MRNKTPVALLGLVVVSLLFAGLAIAEPELDQRQITLDQDHAVLIGGDGPKVNLAVSRRPAR